jgi:hypothetical protein
VDAIPTAKDSASHGLLVLAPEDVCGDLLFEVHRTSFEEETANVELSVARQTEVALESGSSWTTGWEPFQGHAGIAIRNTGGATARFEVTLSDPPSVESVVLAPGATRVVPPHVPAFPGHKFTMTLSTGRNESALLDVEETGYTCVLELGSGGASPSWFQGRLCREACGGDAEMLRIAVTGQDASGSGGTVTLVVRTPDSPVLAAGDPGPDVASTLLLRAFPNPFRESARIAFQLEEASPVRIAVFDVGGRLVRDLGRDAYAAGRHEIPWDGLDSGGRPVRSGMYFFRVLGDGVAGRGKILKLE